MYPLLFAEIDWSQGFMYGILFCGGALVLLSLIYFFRSISANREETANIEANQSIYMGSLVFGIVLIVGGLYFRGTLTASTTGEDSSSMSSFTDFVSKDGRFKVSFPGKPKEQSQSAMGMKIKMFTVEEKDGVFGVAYLDLPGSVAPTGRMIDSSLTSAREGMLHNVGAKLIKEDRIMLQGKYPGREIRADVPSKNAELYCSIYLVNNRAYQVLILGKKDWLNSDKTRKFLNSFALR